MSVLIKGQDGFTKKLLRMVEDSPDGRIKATALAEGPFGMKYSTAVSRKQRLLTFSLRGHSFSCILRNSAFGCRWNRDYSPNFLFARGSYQLCLSKDSNTEGASRVDDP